MITGRIKPSKPAAVFGLCTALAFVGLGIFVVIPKFGAFGVFWTVMAAAIAIYNGFFVFSKSGTSVCEVEIQNSKSRSSLSSRLAELDEARRRGLISASEYEAQRARVISGS
jgi:hypothetical protein